jgi:hypothetical protein
VSDEASKPPVSAEVEIHRPLGEGSPLDEDVELRAAKALHARIQGARKRASLVCLVSGLVLGFILAAVGQSFLADQLGGRFGTLALVIVFFAPLLAALKIAEYIADATVKRSVGGWIEAIAKEHGIPPSALEDHARIAGG